MLSHFLRKWSPFGRADAGPTADRTADGLLWHVLPAAAPLFDTPALAEWVRSGRAVVVKRNLQRTVYRVTLPAGTAFVKVCRTNTPRAWVREILRPPKARLEFENALRLQALGLGCTTALAWGEPDSRWPGDSVIVTREQADAEPLDAYLTDRLPGTHLGVRRQLAVELGRFVARLHDAGVRHPDPHPGNVLVEVPPSRVPRFFLLDVHSVRFGPPLSWAESCHNLVLLNRWFQMRATRADRGRFWRAYAAARTTLELATASSQHAGEVEAATFASNLRFWAARTGRYLGNNRQFRKVKRGALRGHAVKELPDAVLDLLWTDPDAVFARPGVVLLKDSPSATVGVVPFQWGSDDMGEVPTAPHLSPLGRGRTGEAVPGEGTVSEEKTPHPVAAQPTSPQRGEVGRTGSCPDRVRGESPPDASPPRQFAILKRFRLKKRLASLRNLFRRSPALRSWVNGHALLDRGLPTARPLAVLHRRRYGLPAEGYVLFEVVEGAVALPDAVTRFDRRALADRLGRLLRAVHDRQVSHKDLKAPNILVTPAGDPVLIDLVGVTTGRPVPELQRIRELTRLAASFVDSPAVTRTDRLRVLRAYLPANRGDWKKWWTRIAVAVRAKVRRNANLGRPLG